MFTERVIPASVRDSFNSFAEKLEELQTALALIGEKSPDKLDQLVELFQALDPWQTEEMDQRLQDFLELVHLTNDNGETNGLEFYLRVLVQHIAMCQRRERGFNCTPKGVATEAAHVYVGGVGDCPMLNVPQWQSRQSEDLHGYKAVSRIAESRLHTHITGILDSIMMLQHIMSK